MSNSTEACREPLDSAESDPIVAGAIGTRGKVAQLKLAEPAKKEEKEDIHQYLARHRELWLSGF